MKNFPFVEGNEKIIKTGTGVVALLLCGLSGLEVWLKW
jgi:hypothetical protein